MGPARHNHLLAVTNQFTSGLLSALDISTGLLSNDGRSLPTTVILSVMDSLEHFRFSSRARLLADVLEKFQIIVSK